MTRNRRQPLVLSQQETEALSPTFLKELNPANNHVNERRSTSFPSQAFRQDPSTGRHLDCRLMRTTEADNPAQLYLDSYSPETVR